MLVSADTIIPYHAQQKPLKTLKLAVFSGLFYAGGLALFDYGDGVDFRLGKFIFNFLFFSAAMGWMLLHPKKEN